MGEAVKGILSSKKFIFALFSMGVLALENKLGLNLDAETRRLFFGLASLAIAGQAAADFGKEKAKIETNGAAK